MDNTENGSCYSANVEWREDQTQVFPTGACGGSLSVSLQGFSVHCYHFESTSSPAIEQTFERKKPILPLAPRSAGAPISRL
jgi:hypothetical protein